MRQCLRTRVEVEVQLRVQVEPVVANRPSLELKLPVDEEEQLEEAHLGVVDVVAWAADSRVEDVLVKSLYAEYEVYSYHFNKLQYSLCIT